jgi:chaperonin GroES
MMKPLGERVVIEVADGDTKTASGIVLPDTAKEKPQKGTVVAVGSGKLLDNGSRAPMEVKAGDAVVFSKYSGTEVKEGDKNYLVVRESDILAIL